MALINCYQYNQDASMEWKRSGGVYKIRPGGVVAPQVLGFKSFKLQRLLIAISTEFAKLQAQFHGHLDKGSLTAAIRTVVTEAGLAPANAPPVLQVDTDDVGLGGYVLKLFIIDGAADGKQALLVGITADANQNSTCISCGQRKERPKMDPRVKSHSVIPASFWIVIVPSALATIGVEMTAFTGDDQILYNSLVNAGNEAAGTYAKPGADAQAISMSASAKVAKPTSACSSGTRKRNAGFATAPTPARTSRCGLLSAHNSWGSTLVSANVMRQSALPTTWRGGWLVPLNA